MASFLSRTREAVTTVPSRHSGLLERITIVAQAVWIVVALFISLKADAGLAYRISILLFASSPVWSYQGAKWLFASQVTGKSSFALYLAVMPFCWAAMVFCAYDFQHPSADYALLAPVLATIFICFQCLGNAAEGVAIKWRVLRIPILVCAAVAVLFVVGAAALAVFQRPLPAWHENPTAEDLAMTIREYPVTSSWLADQDRHAGFLKPGMPSGLVQRYLDDVFPAPLEGYTEMNTPRMPSLSGANSAVSGAPEFTEDEVTTALQASNVDNTMALRDTLSPPVPPVMTAGQPAAGAPGATQAPTTPSPAAKPAGPPVFSMQQISDADQADVTDNIMALRSNLMQASQNNPDQVAKAAPIALQTGLPLGTVQRNLPDLTPQQKFTQEYVANLQKEYPNTAKWLADPNNRAIVYSPIPSSDVPRNAIKWIQKDAEQGNTAAQALIGFAYIDGEADLPMDPGRGYAWLNLAALGGEPTALKYRESVGRKLDPEALAAAKTLSQILSGAMAPKTGKP